MKSQKMQSLAVSTGVYPLEAVYSACYSFLERAYFRLEEGTKGKVIVRYKAKAAADGKAAVLEDEFLNELLHHALRHKVTQANQKIREYIVTQALVSAQPPTETAPEKVEAMQTKVDDKLDADLEKEIEKLLAEAEKQTGAEDPLQIAVPWEEKFAQAPEGKREEAKTDAPDVQPETVSPDRAPESR